MNLVTYPKEAGAIATYAIDWSPWLAGRTILSSVYTVGAGLTVLDTDNTTTTTTIQVSGGDWGEEFELLNHVVLSNGDEEEHSITIKIQYDVHYCTATEVRRRATQATVNVITDAELDALIEQASRFFDRLCGVPDGYFNQPLYPDPTERVVRGDGGLHLRLDPYIPGTLVSPIAVPENYTIPDFLERGSVPSQYLVLSSSDGVLYNRWNSYFRDGWWDGVAITVSARWGFPETPPEVRLAVIELIINVFRTTDPAQVKITNIESQITGAPCPPKVLEIARRLRPQRGVFV